MPAIASVRALQGSTTTDEYKNYADGVTDALHVIPLMLRLVQADAGRDMGCIGRGVLGPRQAMTDESSCPNRWNVCAQHEWDPS